MAENVQSSGLGRLIKYSDLIIPGLILVVISFMIFPLPAWALDIFLALNLTFSVLVLLVTLYTAEPLQFSSFPSLLLIATLVRLGFNISATRLILGHGSEGTDAAGHMIEAFGNFVGGNDPVVGIVVFLILIVIQFVVITSGAQRVSEVAARFTLDAMPGKQMAIDADLNSGLINEQEARARREKIAKEANFYGAMDGASKFVRGDAIAAIIIVAVNILGGFVIGVLRSDSSIQQVLKTYTLLTIGDGLVTQIPALLIATATGLLVTRSSADSNIGNELSLQVFGKARPMGIAAAALAVLALFFPGWSRIPLLVVAGAAAFGYSVLSRAAKAELEKRPASTRPSR